MIVGSNEYFIVKYPNIDWIFSYERLQLESGNFVNWDRGISADRPITSFTVQGPYDDIVSLSNRLSDYRETFFFNESEHVFGPHIDATGGILCYASNIKPIVRKNTNQWLLTFTLATELDLDFKSGVIATIDDMWYPSSYTAGQELLGSDVTIDSYGGYSLSHSHDIPVHSLTFSLDTVKSGSMIRYFTELVRSNAFTLPVDWLTINPFAQEVFTHAIVLNMDYKQADDDTFTINLDLQGYNTGT